MALASPLKLPDAEKLDTLRRLDQFRAWRSLNDQRYCIACGHLITGREIRVIGGVRGSGPIRIICPTKNCNSIPMDWTLPTPEVLTRLSPSVGTTTARGKNFQRNRARDNSLNSRWRRLARRLYLVGPSFRSGSGIGI